jgi:hypothetical protein
MPWRLIPQTIYDLLGRILPGAVVLLDGLELHNNALRLLATDVVH